MRFALHDCGDGIVNRT